jgi:hypothetical protein
MLEQYVVEGLGKFYGAKVKNAHMLGSFQERIKSKKKESLRLSFRVDNERHAVVQN